MAFDLYTSEACKGCPIPEMCLARSSEECTSRLENELSWLEMTDSISGLNESRMALQYVISEQLEIVKQEINQ